MKINARMNERSSICKVQVKEMQSRRLSEGGCKAFPERGLGEARGEREEGGGRERSQGDRRHMWANTCMYCNMYAHAHFNTKTFQYWNMSSTAQVQSGRFSERESKAFLHSGYGGRGRGS